MSGKDCHQYADPSTEGVTALGNAQRNDGAKLFPFLMNSHRRYMMPKRLKKPCSYPRCPELIESGSYCEKHKKTERQRYDQARGNSRERGYTSAWDKLRKWFLTNNPLCYDCLERGEVTPGKVVHHIKPKSEGGSDDTENLMTLCHRCHNVRHERFNGKRQKTS